MEMGTQQFIVSSSNH